MEQLDGLAAELAEAGRLARVNAANRERPEPAFAVRLRSELMRELPASRSALEAALADDLAAAAPVPPARPLSAPDRFIERRHGNRPFAGPDRRSWSDGLGPETLEVISATTLDGASRTRAGRRWESVHDPAGPERAHGTLGVLPEQTESEAEDSGRVTALKPSMRWHIPTRVMPSRWIGAGLAASIALASLLYGSGVFWPARTSATADEAVSAMLVRGGSTRALTSGMELREGDEIRVTSAGRVTLRLGGSYVRMAGGADMQLKSLDPNHVVVSQIAGRVYHRVEVAAGGDYQVATAAVTWKAVGTAFDLNRYFTAGGGEQVRGLALYDGVDVHGPGLQDNLAEGTSATIVLSPDGSPVGSPVIEPITAAMLADDWLIGNAGLDAQLGLPLGRLAAVLSPEPTDSQTVAPATVPTDHSTGTPTAAPTATPTPAPTPKLAPAAPPTAGPTPTGPASLGQLTYVHNGDGTYTFNWPKYKGSWAGGSQYYKLMHANYPSTPNYGTSGDYWACNDSQNDTSWTDSIPPGDYNVRAQVIDESGGSTIIRAQTAVIHVTVSPTATLPPTVNLGALSAHENGDHSWTFSWAAYTGGPFSYYKLVYETWGSGRNPSYPGGSPYWAAPGPGQTSVTLAVGCGGIQPDHYRVRIQAIGYPNGAYAYAQTTVLDLLVVQAPSPSPSASAS
jgi:hypothetical protein